MASKRAVQIHQAGLRRLMKDPRLSPDRRLLTQMLLMAIEEIIPLSFVQDIWSKAKMTSVETKSADINPNTAHYIQANSTIKDALKQMLGEEQNADTTSE